MALHLLECAGVNGWENWLFNENYCEFPFLRFQTAIPLIGYISGGWEVSPGRNRARCRKQEGSVERATRNCSERFGCV